MLIVNDLLNTKGREVVTIAPATPVGEALKFLLGKGVGSLVVMNRNHRLVGILSERDLLRRYVLSERKAKDLCVKDIMTRKVITVPPEHTIEDCMLIMTERRIRHLPVVKRDVLLGLISIGDVVKGLASEKEGIIHNLEQYIIGS